MWIVIRTIETQALRYAHFSIVYTTWTTLFLRCARMPCVKFTTEIKTLHRILGMGNSICESKPNTYCFGWFYLLLLYYCLLHCRRNSPYTRYVWTTASDFLWATKYAAEHEIRHNRITVFHAFEQRQCLSSPGATMPRHNLALCA